MGATFNLSSLHLLLLVMFFFVGLNFGNSRLLDSAATVCDFVNCGQGTCKPSTSYRGFDCECYPGWKQMPPSPSCIFPNCMLNFGGESPSPTPSQPPVPALRSPNDILDPCDITWCGDGTCVNEGTAYSCVCNQGSNNLLNNISFPCFKEGNIGADCQFFFGSPAPAPAPAPVLQN